MARSKKDELTSRLDEAKASGSYMVAVWKVHDGKVDLFRLTDNFPVVEMPGALGMLTKNLEPEMLAKASEAPEAPPSKPDPTRPKKNQ